MGNQEEIFKATRQQNVRFSSYFRSDFKFGNETHTVCGVTSFQGLPAFLSRSSECCGHEIFLRLKATILIKSSGVLPSRSSHKKASPLL